MTTPQTGPDRLRWWRYLGPWPLRPVAMGIIITLATLLTSSALLRRENIPIFLLSAVVSGLVGGAFFWLASRYAPRFIATWPGYLLAIVCAAALVVVIRSGTGTVIDYPGFSQAADLTFALIRTSLAAIVILALLGVSSRRLQLQVDRTQAALDLVRAQASALLQADETVRQQVAATLHDRVQAGLIGACLQLQSILPRVGPADADLVRRIIASLEELRSLDIRRAVRSLSPNLREVDLLSALEDLCETYRPGLDARLEVSAPDLPYEVRLGAYRIVEQSLLNSVMHGRARTCRVSIRPVDGRVEVTILDDGVGTPATATPGLGSTLISTWCRTLDGHWSREPAPAGGTIVRATLPLPATEA